MAGVDRRIAIRHLLAGAVEGARVEVTGWVKTSRFSKNVSFVHVYDGSTTRTIQVVLDAAQAETWGPRLGIGAAVRFAGVWVKSPGGEQAFEVAAETVEVIGDSDPATYPLQKKATSLEHLREIAHLRPRTNTFQSVNRVRNALSHNIHRYFQERGFLWIHTPIISTADAEGAGEQFHVTAGTDPKDFFGQPAYLTVSRPARGETFALASRTSTPSAPRSAPRTATPRHAAEFWMIEPEMASATSNDDIDARRGLREAPRRTPARPVRRRLRVLQQVHRQGLVARLRLWLERRLRSAVTYTEAQSTSSSRAADQFEYPVGWGDPSAGRARALPRRRALQGPVFVTNYPAEQKAFYMRLERRRKTVPPPTCSSRGIGEIIGGIAARGAPRRARAADARIMGLDPRGLLVVPRPAALRHRPARRLRPRLRAPASCG
jgi:asparaginyl-tRNA synthetase